MKKKNKLMMMGVSVLLASAFSTAHAFANREICGPQDGNLALGEFSTTCDWSKWYPGQDQNAIITLNGGMYVHAECQFSGEDRIAVINPNKHSEFKPVVTPGDQFSFDIGYKPIAGSNDDNQNIIIWLATRKPDASNVLTCQFYPNLDATHSG